jgi:hypothetical protein
MSWDYLDPTPVSMRGSLSDTENLLPSPDPLPAIPDRILTSFSHRANHQQERFSGDFTVSSTSFEGQPRHGVEWKDMEVARQ